MPARCKKSRVVHVNLLKKRYSRGDEHRNAKFVFITGVVNEIGQAASEDYTEFSDNDVECNIVEANCIQIQTWQQAEITSDITSAQRCEVERVLNSYSEIFSDVPGRTVEHHIELVHREPVRQGAYRMPHAWRDPVKKELNQMLELGIIEPTTSTYASPIVVVPKPDGSVRVCTDYRRLNSKSKFDPYVMPRVDDILDKVGNAKFITTLDLTKGFYQIR
ncbi:hypothetical protein HOLleu_04222 [Holothuria leucospilota]|uniref:Uncharacterized protein n=1 Tax=Holothuria leucospilota TaxID=206669 RepID=A0A9Q1HM96_HOLLE|nr:hypothetical protein HOLleu_04222 [Holothuria leucospilota]